MKPACCTVCQSPSLITNVDFGKQVPANHFIGMENTPQAKHPLALGHCPQCATIQLTERMPMMAIRPRYDWLTYNEPEHHLDDVVRHLIQLPYINPQSRSLGITYKDQSTLTRLNHLGLKNNICLTEKDFINDDQPFGLETLQDLLSTPSVINNIRTIYGQFDLILLRHVLEHAENAKELINCLKALLKPNGYIIIELPDSEKILTHANHAFIWEEHISYFTEKSLLNFAHRTGGEISWFKRYCYPYEDSLLIALRFSQDTLISNAIYFKENLDKDTEQLLIEFSNKLTLAKNNWRKQLMQFINQDKKIAIFGAGHLAAKFINFLNLQDLIEYVIDDHPKKIGMKMPGSMLPIISSKKITENNINICISTLNPESEIKVKQKLSEFFNNGGLFLPAFISRITQ